VAKVSKLKIENVKALVELDRLGIKYEPTSADEVKIKCPVHKEGKEESPSCFLNVKKNLFMCQTAGCQAHGDIVSLFAFIANVPRDVIILDLQGRYDLEVKKTISPENVERFHEAIWEAGPLLKLLYDRGITNDMIRKARLGYHSGRITIPIYDLDGSIVEIRRYLPGAPGAEKMRNTPGYGGNHIYQVDQAKKFDTVWVCGGEMKALVAGWLLNEHGVGAVSDTAGEGNWEAENNKFFKDKRVYICLDVDKGGNAGSQTIAGYLFNVAKVVYVIRLPLDRTKYPKGDINDLIGQEGGTAQTLLQCMTDADQWYPPDLSEEKDQEIYKVILSESTHAEHVGKKIEVCGIVSSMDTDTYLVPRKVNCVCDKSQPGCSWCPVKNIEPNKDGQMETEVRSSNAGLLEMINAPKSKLKDAMREALRIPACKSVEFHVRSHYNVSDLRLSPQLNIGSESSKNVVQPAFVVGKNIEMNTPYIFRGKVYPQPRNQQAVLLLNEMEQGTDSLGSFKPSDEDLDALKIFRPTDWSEAAIGLKLKDIYDDFETNVTQIFHRQDLHLTVDLCYHSILTMNFDGQETKGWVNILIAGDSSQGKSAVAAGYDGNGGLMKHYGLGERVDCKNATVAGLLGGLHQIGTRWFVSWGVIPTHDRRMAILEEIGGTDPEVLTKLTDMRSSGIAEIPKIEKRRALARTRLLLISNSRDGRATSAHNFGIEIIRGLLQRPEDIRRLDFAILVSSLQVNPDEINKLARNRPVRQHTYKKELCQRLILWAWTRTVSQVAFESDAVTLILERATYLSKKFSESIPLVDRGTMRIKLARLACSLAARTFSASDDMQALVVRVSHVEYISNFVDRVYSDKVFGYSDFSKAQIHANAVLDPDAVKKQIESTKHPADFVKMMLYTETISMNDICDWCEVDRDIGQKLMSFFVRKHALYRVKREYQKTSDFISLLKEMERIGVKKAGSADLSKEEF